MIGPRLGKKAVVNVKSLCLVPLKIKRTVSFGAMLFALEVVIRTDQTQAVEADRKLSKNLG